MKRYYADLVDRGFDELHQAMVSFIVSRMKRQYGSRWWDEVLDALNEQRMLPGYGDEKDLIACLDRANCCRLIDRKSWELFYDQRKSGNCKVWAKELMGIRNELAHISIGDLPQKDAERYLDTMVRLATEIDPACAASIKELYQEARASAPDVAKAAQETYYEAADQAGASDPTEMDLLGLEDRGLVELTGLTRKLTINGETKAYPVYRVRLDLLFYNDRNDRILTWISQYRDETGIEDLGTLSREEYNRVIEEFIIKSNPSSIEKTCNSMRLVGQREPGVTLSDGRIVDGNRRFTCLRMLQREDPSVAYFETVILSKEPSDNAKQVKLLELAIQHGEEQRVDYNLIDHVLGAYMDIVETGLLTVEEYASTTFEPVAEVKKKLDIAQLIIEFLAFMRTPGQYHIARDMQSNSLLVELLPLLNRCKTEKEREELKKSVFMNMMLSTFSDQRKYIRNLKSLIGTQPYKTYMQREGKMVEQLEQAMDEYGIGGMDDLHDFIEGQAPVRAELALSFEKALNQSRKAQTKSKPAKNLAKCIELLLEIDTDVFAKLSEEELTHLRTQFAKLAEVEELIARDLPEA